MQTRKNGITARRAFGITLPLGMALVCAIIATIVLINAPMAMAASPVVSGSICTIHFMDGKPIKFEIKRTTTDPSISEIISNARHMNAWMIELDNRTLVIPMINVRYIEISPALKATREPIIRGTLIE
jgi:hypothetical protein